MVAKKVALSAAMTAERKADYLVELTAEMRADPTVQLMAAR